MDKELIKDKVEYHIRAQANGLVWERIRDQDLIPDLLICPPPNMIKNQIWWQVWNKFNKMVYRPVYDQVWMHVWDKIRSEQWIKD